MTERMDLDDVTVVRRVRGGEVELFRVLVERYRGEFGRYAVAMVDGDVDTAQDAMQEAFIRAFESLASCRDPSRFKAWFFRILKNQCHNARSRTRRQVPLNGVEAEAGSGADSELKRGELQGAIEAALEALTPEQREAFVMKHIEGRSYAEMAELLDTGEDALKMRVYRARDELKRRLEDLR
ncbi:MAG: RNA polymerase sigma factor [Gemmatimonadales bacterium]